jgi:hypothetical protein
MTVNHDVTGSSPVGGAKKNRVAKAALFLFVFIISAQLGSKGGKMFICNQLKIRRRALGIISTRLHMK